MPTNHCDTAIAILTRTNQRFRPRLGHPRPLPRPARNHPAPGCQPLACFTACDRDTLGVVFKGWETVPTERITTSLGAIYRGLVCPGVRGDHDAIISKLTGSRPWNASPSSNGSKHHDRQHHTDSCHGNRRCPPES